MLQRYIIMQLIVQVEGFFLNINLCNSKNPAVKDGDKMTGQWAKSMFSEVTYLSPPFYLTNIIILCNFIKSTVR